ncbi:MAG: hypothetical protein JSW06_11225 [Thermoplasmatales archaeon]|nr:MAG: hypothetical protein JSW06_11225 [Thermoplasmatales archaeon]
MKLKILQPISIGILLLGFFSIILFEECDAGDENHEISIENKSYEVVKTEKLGTQTVTYFKISIILHNSDNIISEDITVTIWDENDGHQTHRNGTIPPGKSLPFVFGESNDWMVVGLGEHNVNIIFSHTNESRKTQYNSGSSTLVIRTNDAISDNSSPGFEIILVVISIVALMFFKRKNKR